MEAFKRTWSPCGRSQTGGAEEVVARRAPSEVAIRSFVGGGRHGWALRCVTPLHKGLRMHAEGKRTHSRYRVELQKFASSVQD